MSLVAYFDESGTHSGGPNAAKTFVIAGYIAPESIWRDVFTPQWAALLDRFELPDKPVPRYFHATEVESGGYPYNRLTERQREDLKMSAVTIALNCGIIGVGGGVMTEAYKRLMAPYFDERSIPKDPYVFLFTDVLLQCIEVSHMFIGEKSEEKIGFVFENHPRWSLEAHEMFVMLQTEEEWPSRTRLGTVAFEEKKLFPPLQVADHLAFETYHYMDNDQERPAMNRFRSWPQNHGRYYNEEGLKGFLEICKRDGKL